jgi:hypothetical protein
MQAKNFEELKKEEIFEFDTEKYPLLQAFRRIFEEWPEEEELGQIHRLVPESTQEGYVEFKNDQATWFHKKYYNSPYLPQFLEIYTRLVKELISQQFDDDVIVYQTKPTFRVHSPNNVAVGQKHRDGDYHHPPGEINFWLPLTRTFETNSFFMETEPDKGDFHSLDMHYGQIFRFYGNKCWHYNELNRTGQTRLSIDFRVIPGSLYTESPQPSADGQSQAEEAQAVKSGLKFNIGSYYSLYRKNSE